MKILNSAQLREIDAYTIENTPILSIELMERAAQACFQAILKLSLPDSRFLVVCGTGNNGGDGFAIARLLQNAGKRVMCIYIDGNTSPDNAINRKRFYDLEGSKSIAFKDLESLSTDGITHIIDALLGSGMNRQAEGDIADCIDWMNKFQAIRISIDIPTGFPEDKPLETSNKIVKAHHTLCFHAARLAYFFPESYPFIGKWQILDIGLIEPPHIRSLEHAVLLGDAKQFLPPIHPFSHKGTNGHALVIGGSYGKTGAICLTAKAAARSGAGLVSVYAPKNAYQIVQSGIPEAMFIPSDEENFVSGLPQKLNFQAIGFGPGAGVNESTAASLKLLIQQSTSPLVIDADGLNLLSENKTWLSFLPPHTILTPHPKEMERLCGKWQNSFEQLEIAREFCRKYHCILVLKGAYTASVLPDGLIFFNTSGNPGMATGGSGDVLTGILTGLLARGLKAYAAAILGVYLHGLAGDYAAEMNGIDALLAGDIIDSLPKAWQHLRES